MNQIERKRKELYKLSNRARRHLKRLVLESFRIAKNKGIELTLSKGEIAVKTDISIELPDYGCYVDTDTLINLAQNSYPSLYRRYHQQREKYLQGLEELKRLQC